jgi:coenzyme F420 hydrogenase subunit beta
MENHEPKFISDENVDNCKKCGVCYYICPQTTPLLKEITETYKIADELGFVRDIIAAKTTDEKIHEIGQDGGLVTTILTYLFDKNEIDGAVVSEYDENLQTIPKIIHDKEDLAKSAGTRYSISSNILPLEDLTQIAGIIMEKKGMFDLDKLRIAFIGTPCQVRAIRKMQFLNVSPAHVVKYVFGLFCMENFNHEKLFELVKAETNEEPSNISRMNIKKNFYITNKSDTVHEVELHKFDDAVRSSCHECDEFTGRFSDISFGGSGAVQKNNMIIIRTEKGQALINTLISEGYIQQFLPKTMTLPVWKGKKLGLLKRMTTNKTEKNK